MKKIVLLDTGPLVAFINRKDTYHVWATEQLSRITPPLISCEAVLSESCFLLRNLSGGSNAVLEIVKRELISLPFQLQKETTTISKLISRYENVPISLADACLVRMAEQNPDSTVLTLDSDFTIYRKNRRQVIPTIMPELES